MRIESLASSPCASGSCAGGPVSPERFAQVRESVRSQRPDRVTISQAVADDRGIAGPSSPIRSVPSAASGEPTDPEAAGLSGSPRGALIAQYAAAGSDPSATRLELYA